MSKKFISPFVAFRYLCRVKRAIEGMHGVIGRSAGPDAPADVPRAERGLDDLIADAREGCKAKIEDVRAEGAEAASNFREGSPTRILLDAIAASHVRSYEHEMRDDHECAVCEAVVPNCVCADVGHCDCAPGQAYRAQHTPSGYHVKPDDDLSDPDRLRRMWAEWDAGRPCDARIKLDLNTVPEEDYTPEALASRKRAIEFEQMLGRTKRGSGPRIDVTLIPVEPGSDAEKLLQKLKADHEKPAEPPAKA